LHFTSIETASTNASAWGGRCNIRKASTLDVGMCYDEDPYRRHLTCELWIKCYIIPENIVNFMSGRESILLNRIRAIDDAASSHQPNLWQFSILDGHLALSFLGRTVKSEEKIKMTDVWQHVAFTIDILSEDKVLINRFFK